MCRWGSREGSIPEIASMIFTLENYPHLVTVVTEFNAVLFRKDIFLFVSDNTTGKVFRVNSLKLKSAH
jgi:hypothetical protein